jgi:hypothetical protein
MQQIRFALASLDPGSVAHQAQDEPAEATIYPVRGHDSALTFDRPLVVGNRGMGKSFWAAVLSHQEGRKRASELYPRARLDGLQVALGFHEAAGKRSGDLAPSQREVAELLRQKKTAETIWHGVLLRALAGTGPVPQFDNLQASIAVIEHEPLKYEQWLREADNALQGGNKRFLLLFDALDRLSNDWHIIRNLTRELLRLSLDLTGYRAIRAKIFMRSDQYSDGSLFDFQDASKIKIGAVKLEWKRADLYGFLFTQILNNAAAACEFEAIILKAAKLKVFSDDLRQRLREDEILQADIFSQIAGQFMGTDRRRGRTYTWLHQHLADAFEQTSPRSFVLAVNRAATSGQAPAKTAIDYNGIKEGVVAASRLRVDELKEDNIWIGQALDDLVDLEVPCDPKSFIQRWKARETVRRVEAMLKDSERPGPLAFEDKGLSREKALLQSLIALGVVEERAQDRVNMPDLCRVAARIKRRGGVKPPARS